MKRSEYERINVIKAKRRLVTEALDQIVQDDICEMLRDYDGRAFKEFFEQFDKRLDEMIDTHDELIDFVNDYYRNQMIDESEDEDEED